MAKNTPMELRNALIYSIYVRNHTREGSFKVIEADLPRIRALGTDIVWFIPIHPIGVEGKKGSLGCPYANKDYRSVHPDYGTMDDFRHLVDAIHANGMKCMIDVVYNHTSPDSTLRHEHPEFFYHKPDGSFGNRFGNWSDVIDLDYTVRGLWDYQIESLKFWAGIVDGFRCDVASLVPVDFWKEARAACEAVKPGLIWLAESVHTRFQRGARRAGMSMIYSDSEGYEAFDMEYDYDIREKLDDYWEGKRPLHEWIDDLNFQEAIYPWNYIKMRCLENHDQPRIAHRITDARALENWHAFLFFQKGTTLIYAGEERCDANLPSLFDKDPVNWNGPDISDQLTHLAKIKKAYFPVDGCFGAVADDAQHAVCARFENRETLLCGLFSLKGQPVQMKVDAPDGSYTDLISGSEVQVENGMVKTEGKPLIFKVK